MGRQNSRNSWLRSPPPVFFFFFQIRLIHSDFHNCRYLQLDQAAAAFLAPSFQMMFRGEGDVASLSSSSSCFLIWLFGVRHMTFSSTQKTMPEMGQKQSHEQYMLQSIRYNEDDIGVYTFFFSLPLWPKMIFIFWGREISSVCLWSALPPPGPTYLFSDMSTSVLHEQQSSVLFTIQPHICCWWAKQRRRTLPNFCPPNPREFAPLEAPQPLRTWQCESVVDANCAQCR